MRKFLTMILTLILVLSLCGCAGENTAPSEALLVGYGRENITPTFSVGLGGYGDSATRRSEDVVDEVFATCIAMTQDGQTILLYTIDNCSANQSVVDQVRSVVSSVTAVPADHIFVSATHTHSAPALTNADEEGLEYQELFYIAMLDAATAAIADQAVATVSTCTTELENMNAVRHYLLENGTYAGSNFGDFKSAAIVDHATESDRRMVLVKFDRTDEAKQDILLMNWQAHADRVGEIGYNNISSTFIGPARTRLETQTGMLFAYFTGAGGNQNMDSRIKEESNGLNWVEYGETLADFALDSLPNLVASEDTAIKTTQILYDAEIDHSWDSYLVQAGEVYALWKSEGKAAGDALGKKYNFTSVYQARAIRSRANKPLTEQIELNAFTVGGIGFITGTYEMFSDTGIYVREHSPFETTVICTGNAGYIPTAAAYDYRSYEADTGYYAKGTAEKLAEKYVEMLNNLQQ